MRAFLGIFSYKTWFFLLLVGLFGLQACSIFKTHSIFSNQKKMQQKQERTLKEDQRFQSFLDEAFKAYADRHPQFLTDLGSKKHYDKLEDMSEGFQKREIKIYKKEIQKLKSFRYKDLDSSSQINYSLFLQKRKKWITDWKHRFYSYPINQMFGYHKYLPSFMIAKHRIENIKDAKDYISRLKAFRLFFGQIVEFLKIQEKKGIDPPAFVFPKAIQDSKNIISGDPFSSKMGKPSVLYKDFMGKINRLKGVKKKEKLELKKGVKEALLKFVQPAYLDLVHYLKKRSESVKDEKGLWQFGSRIYKKKLEHYTTTSLTPKEIHQIGLQQVSQIQGEIRSLMRKMSFQGSLKDFFRFLKKEDFFYPSTLEGRKAYLLRSREILQEIKLHLPQLFSLFPKAKVKIRVVEKFREKTSGIAFYSSPSEKGERPGYYYVNLSRLKSLPKYEMRALLYHEALPGHHMQIAMAVENRSIPSFRRHWRITAFVEGWALYAERLAKEMGLYKDLYSQVGFLTMQLWRATRLVVDTGLHKYRWTPEQAIEYLAENMPGSRATFQQAVQRYLVMPGQATAYMIGQLKILELRQKAERQLKENFNIRAFHDEILKHGALPLKILEDIIDQFIENQTSLKKI